MKMSSLILPSLLSADITRLGEEVENVMASGADMIHLDVMDNHYVPNLTFGPLILEGLKKRFPELPVDVHLMVTPTDELAKTFATFKPQQISFHPEASNHPQRTLALIKEYGVKAGLALNPATTEAWLTWCQSSLDFVLIMLVNPGFAGQTLISDVIPKIELIRKKYPSLPIQVDGGVSLENLHLLKKAGANQFIAGSSIFKAKQPYREVIDAMRKELSS